MAPIVTSLASIVKQFGIGALVSGGDGGGTFTETWATGGVISDYEDSGSPGTYYRAHVFTSSGSFDVSDAQLTSVEYLVVAGGGGGGFSFNAGGGGGAGGLRTNLTGHPLAPNESPFPVSPGPYGVTVGSGGAGGPASKGNGGNGTSSVFGPGPVTSQGGGGGGSPGDGGPGIPGGSGGGGGTYPNGGEYAGGTGSRVTGTSTPAPTQGNPGGTGEHVANSWEGGGGGGGAGSAGGNGQNGPGADSYGGTGVQVLIAGSSVNIGSQDGPSPGGSWFAGGGGGAPRGVAGRGTPTTVGSTDYSGGGAGGPGSLDTIGVSGLFNTGGGGGGSGWSGGPGGHGGSGIVVVRYQIPSSAGTAKATGGAISFYDGMTIHTFTSSGNFTASEPLTVEYVAIGGGGGGGTTGGGGGGGGGGAGLFLNETGIPINADPFSISIGAGGRGLYGSVAGVNARGNSTTIAFPSGTKTATYGGGGDGIRSVDPGGSGGGAGNATPAATGGTGLGDPYPGTPGTTPTSGWGHDGGDCVASAPQYGGGGGGGAGGAGGDGSGTTSGHGGAGVQLPATFRDPASTVGAPGPSGSFWVAGGGGAGAGYNGGPGSGPIGIGGGPGGPFAGGGDGGYGNSGDKAEGGLQNTGGGGGGSNSNGIGGSGGSGIVLIAYPS